MEVDGPRRIEQRLDLVCTADVKKASLQLAIDGALLLRIIVDDGRLSGLEVGVGSGEGVLLGPGRRRVRENWLSIKACGTARRATGN
jgi:hypothetical protein